ncbi:MAG TPA: permease [Acidimicrobiales bacterium]|nr:permease [Acidimicrobiales bacterium]
MVRAVTDQSPPPGAHTAEQARSVVRRPDVGVAIVAVVVVAAALFRPLLQDLLDRPAIANWATVFVAITVQAMPFLVLGVTISAVVAAFVPAGLLPRLLPRRPALAVPAAAAAGAALPGCECGSVPIAQRLVARGAPAPAALAFLLSAPAINPVVLVATAVAFPGRPAVVLARFLASLIAATVVGLLWARRGGDDLLDRARRRIGDDGPRLAVLTGTAQHDLLHAGGFLIVGAATAATLQTVVPRSVLDAVADAGPLAVLALAGLAVVMAICSEADAFIAASLTEFSLTARLAFMVVGPMVDVKLVALQAGTFGRRFALRFAPLTLVVAVASSAVIGWWLL